MRSKGLRARQKRLEAELPTFHVLTLLVCYQCVVFTSPHVHETDQTIHTLVQDDRGGIDRQFAASTPS
jgi:hypothetical protein